MNISGHSLPACMALAIATMGISTDWTLMSRTASPLGIYMDPASVAKQADGISRVSVLQDFSQVKVIENPHWEYKSAIYLYVFNCPSRLLTLGPVVYYTGNMGTGSTAGRDNFTPGKEVPWKPVNPGTVNDAILHLACR